MARARKRPASPKPVEEVVEEQAEEMEVDEEAARPLQFDEPLTWRAGRPVAVADLLRRLKALYEELVFIEQEHADRETLVPKAQELANVQLLGHKDKGVKAWALLCVVEMFRLLAPDAPYKARELREIFTVFVSTIVPALASPSDPYNQQHINTLTSLTNVKSIILLTDLPGYEKLVLNLFENCFDVLSGNVRGASGESLPKNIEYHMTSMLCTLVDECPQLPTGVIDIVLAQFLRADPNALSAGNRKDMDTSQLLREVSPAYNMARSVCNTCAEKMSRAIGQYFSSVLVDASQSFSNTKLSKPRGKKRTHDESEDESDDGLLTPPAEADLEEVEKAHRLLRELWRSSPDVIRDIVPQMELELGIDNVPLRAMAVHTIGDMIAGIGAAGPPPSMPLEPAAYPSQSLDVESAPTQQFSVLLIPAAPHAFSSVYSSCYQAFIDRNRDKAAQVRSAWVTEAGRIIATSGGGKGLDAEQETKLLRCLADMLVDSDERVRLASVHAIASFDFSTIVQKLGNNGGVATQGSVLHNLSDRIKDPKHAVSEAATDLLARIWGVAAGAITEGSDRISDLLREVPSKILDAIYVNDPRINALVQRVLFECLLPITYPPIKPASAAPESQRISDSQAANKTPDPDAIRVERILVLVRDLDTRAKPVFFSLQNQQTQKAKYIEAYLKQCEVVYGASEEASKEDKKRLEKLIEAIVGKVPEPTVAAEHLKKFAKHHDRRSYQLIRFCYAPESDYRKIFKAMKELTKRIEESPSSMLGVLDTLLPLIRSAALLVYNKSHVPAIVELCRTDEKGLGHTAHEVLKEISTKAPDIFKVHVLELCQSLKKEVPSVGKPNDPSAVDTLKACAGFARRFPGEMPKDRDFYKAMTAFAVRGTPPKAAKHAVTVIVASAEKKEMYIKDIMKQCLVDFDISADGAVSKLAAISQLRLLANDDTEEDNDAIMEVAIGKVLHEVKTPAEEGDPDWTNEPDNDLTAKLWALKILVNGLRGRSSTTNSEEALQATKKVAVPVYRLLNTLIEREGELSKTESTPKHHKAQLRLAAALQLVKLSSTRAFDGMLSPRDFNRLAKIAQDPLPEVRSGFVSALKKYLGQGRLPNRFYGLVFLYAFEPAQHIKEATVTWLKARAALSAKLKDTVMESVFARFLSLLAHHQDFSKEPDELADFVEYVMFYLKQVATESTLPAIYHIAQRIKSVQDGIDPEHSENLYIMSDLAEAVVRLFQEEKGWSLQLYSGKVRLPTGIFAPLPSHAVAQEISEKRFLPEELAEQLEELVKSSLKPKKRKADGTTSQAAKKAKPTTAPAAKKVPTRKAPKPVKTPKKRRVEDVVPSSDRRRSNRAARATNYAEGDSSEDDEEMKQWQTDDEADKENIESSTPPTSDPTPAAIPIEKAKAPQKPARVVPLRGGKAKKATKDVMDIPSDSDEELSDVPGDMEA